MVLPAKKFAILPEQQQLAAIQRELQFYPADNTNPTALTVDQIRFYNRQGYLSQLQALSERELRDTRSFFNPLLEKVLRSGESSYSISTAHLKYRPVYDLLRHPVIVSYVQDLLGENVIGWGSHFFCKMPHDPVAVNWHQDASYWPLTPSKTVTVWLAIDHVDTENACMKFIPQSHLHGHLPWRESQQQDNNVLDQTVDSALDYGVPVNNVLQAGQMSMHSDLLLHGSEPNPSDRRRCGLTLRYCAADVHAYMDWNLKGIVVAGQADPQLWPGAPAPSETS
ncbi:MAG: phytanoyl-CoA dioxygenase family protein [Planctomycetota bacterium]|nr:phytanoyl-CoA dioxygenase family protein [Planctomycetota bacterium]